MAAKPRTRFTVGAAARRLRLRERLSELIARTVLPARCCLCGAPGHRWYLDLCEPCRAGLPAVASPEPFASGQADLLQARIDRGQCRIAAGCDAPLFSRIVVPFRYAYPVDHFIRALKFRGELVYARVLGMLLAESRLQIPAPPPERLVPVALHTSRYRERGFNQAHELARHAARRLGLRVEGHSLTRVRHTREQSGLPQPERLENVLNAFAVTRPLSAKRIALVDDVLTTGSTAREAARVLRDAGAEDIELWAVARVPHEPQESVGG